MKVLSLKFLPIAVGASLMVFGSCTKEEQISTQSSKNGSFKVRMTDAPGDYAAVDVEITRVDVYHENEGWVNLNSETQFVDVISLTNGAEIDLAQSFNLQSGLYTQLKLTFGERNTLSLNGSASGGGTSGSGSFDLQWAGPEREVIIGIDQEVSATASGNVLIDFHIVESIKEFAGTYIFDPVVTTIEDESTGIQGELEANTRAAIQLTGGPATFDTYTNASGEFLIRGVEPGTYDMIISPAQDAANPTLPEEFRIEGIVIADGQIKQMGTIEF